MKFAHYASLLALAAPPAHAQCPDWAMGFAGTGPNDAVLVHHTDHSLGTPRQFVGGRFTDFRPLGTHHLAAWDGQQWTGFGAGPSGAVEAVVSLDLGGGPVLFAGGQDFLELWDGGTWTPVGLDSGRVRALQAYDDGTGMALYVGGSQLTAAGMGPGVLFRYDGNWTDVEAGVNGLASDFVSCLEVHDDGAGLALYVGGRFNTLGTVPVRHLARWDGTSISQGAYGPPPTYFSEVSALEEAARGGIELLHVGTSEINALPSGWTGWQIARPGAWVGIGDGTEVSGFAMGPGAAGSDVIWAAVQNAVQALDGQLQAPIALPDSGARSGVGLFPGQSGNVVLASLNDTFLPPDWLFGILDGNEWRAPFPALAPTNWIRNACVHDFGSGPEIAAAIWGSNGYEPYRFDGRSWTKIPLPATVKIFDGGIASFEGQLVMGAARLSGTGFTLHPCIAYDGSTWRPFGPDIGFFEAVNVLRSIDLGSGEELFVGGAFDEVFQTPGTLGIARWNGQAFESLGGGIVNTGLPLGHVRDFTGWDDGQGLRLYAAGQFERMGTANALGIAAWDGAQWSSLPGGPNTSNWHTTIWSLTTAELATGRFLIAAGSFDQLGSAPSPGIAAWDGAQWHSMAGSSGDPIRPVGQCYLAGAYDPDGEGDRALCLSIFTTPAGQIYGLGEWDGTQWSLLADLRILGTTNSASVQSLISTDIGDGRALYLVGNFSSIDGTPSQHIAKLVDPCSPQQVGNPYCATFPNSSGQSALCRATGTASLGASDLVLSLVDAPPGATVMFASSQAPGHTTLGSGALCLGGAPERILPPTSCNAQGRASYPIDFGAPYAAATAGSRWYVQAFFRDVTPTGNGIGTSDALAIPIQP